MKKYLSMLIVIIMIFTAVFTAGCSGDPNRRLVNDFGADGNYGSDYFKKISERATLDTENILLDNFNNGISNNWKMVDGQWNTVDAGSEQSVKSSNVLTTDDGAVLFQANGDYHPDYNMRRTGGTLVSNDMYGPGRYEVRMQAAPREGICSAFWTFYHNGKNDFENELWQEIDIEIVGGSAGSFDKIWFTTWRRGVSTVQSNSHKTDGTDEDSEQPFGFILNDGDWHTYSFDWYTNYNGTGKKRIEWFIDGRLIYSFEDQILVPEYAGKLWLGLWMPSWSGVPDFESTYMMVDWVKHTPFTKESNHYEIDNDYKIPYSLTSPNKAKKIDKMPDISQRISNGEFENSRGLNPLGWVRTDDDELTGYQTIDDSDEQNGTKSLKLVRDFYVFQEITAIFPGYKFNFSAWAKKSPDSKAKIQILYYSYSEGLLNSVTININSNDWKEYTAQLTLPDKIDVLQINLVQDSETGTVLFDNVSMMYIDHFPDNLLLIIIVVVAVLAAAAVILYFLVFKKKFTALKAAKSQENNKETKDDNIAVLHTDDKELTTNMEKSEKIEAQPKVQKKSNIKAKTPEKENPNPNSKAKKKS